MAGALHKDYAKRLTGDGQRLIPGSKLPRAYAEGYGAYRSGGLRITNPHGAPIDNVDNASRAWDQGWRDGELGHPATHVGGPNAVAAVVEDTTPARGMPGVRTAIKGAAKLK